MFRARKAEYKSPEMLLQDKELMNMVSFTTRQLQIYSNNFSSLLGLGGFGRVYKGQLPDGQEIAVKVFASTHGMDNEGFMNEVHILGRLHHRHIVRLFGFCNEKKLRALVYEYMPNALDRFLFDEERQALEWGKLYQIAIGIAKGIAYLHEECPKPIVHLDIKPQNILLDADLSPKISDFGIANQWDRDYGPNSNCIRGTVGYIAPEFVHSGIMTMKCDVYSFGVLLFEILGRRRNMSFEQESGLFSQYVIENYINGEFDKVIAVCGIEKDKEKAERLCMVAFWCVQFSPDARPCMTAVVNMLEGVVEVMLPPQNLSSFGFGPSIFSSHCSSDETRSASIIGASVCRDHSKKSGLDSRFKFDGSYRGHTFEIEAVTDSSYAASSDSISEDITDVPLSRSVAETALALTLEASTSNLPPSDTISISMDAISPQVPNNVEGQPLLASDISIPSSCFKNDHQPHLVSVDAGPLVSEEVFDQSYSISDEVKMAFTDLITLLGKGLSAICQDSALSSVLRDILIFLSTLSEEDGISMAAKSLILQIQEQMGPLLLKLQGAHHIINEFEAKIKFERVMELSIMKCKEMMETMAAKLEKEQDSLAKLEVMKAEYEEKLKSINEKILVSRSAANSASQKKDKALKEVKRLGSQYEQVVSQRSALEEQNELAKEVVEEVEEKWADLKELVEQLHVSGVCV